MFMSAPVFFMPNLDLDKQEARYAEFAKRCDCPIPASDQRVFSISYTHDDIRWTATVGESLTGVSTRINRSRGQSIEQRHPHSDPAIVLAIFPDPICYKVVTDGGGGRSQRANPFLAGKPDKVVGFSVAGRAGG
jgi:hypothetical protein